MRSIETEVIERFNEAFNAHDPAGMMGLMTDDPVFENTYPPPEGARFQGRAAVKGFWEDFFRASPKAQIEIEELFFCDGRGIQRWIYRWTDEQGVEGFVRGVDVFRFQEGRIAEKFSYVKG